MGGLGDDTWVDLLALLAGISRMSQADRFERADSAEMPLHTLVEYTVPVSHRLLRTRFRLAVHPQAGRLL